MQIAKRLNSFQPSATLAVDARAKALISQGVDIISLATGEPDFATPSHIIQAMKDALDAGYTKYTQIPGLPEARKAVANYYQRQYDAKLDFTEVMLSNGGKHSLYNVLLTVLNPNDEIIIPAPYWTSYPDMVHLVDATPIIIQTGSKQNFKVTPEQLNKALTPKTKMLLFNSPSNPSGACYSQSEVDAIMQWAVDHEIIVLADEIYDRLVYAPAKAISVVNWYKKYPEYVVITNGLAKTFAMTGFRVGYTVATPELISAMSQVQGQATSCISAANQMATVTALNSSYDCVELMRSAFEKRRDKFWQEISSWQGVVCPKPDGAFYLFPDVSALYSAEIPDDLAMCAKLLEEAKVALVPGRAFGDKNCIRLTYAINEDKMSEALRRIKACLYNDK